jgi:hypothetical protein
MFCIWLIYSRDLCNYFASGEQHCGSRLVYSLYSIARLLQVMSFVLRPVGDEVKYLKEVRVGTDNKVMIGRNPLTFASDDNAMCRIISRKHAQLSKVTNDLVITVCQRSSQLIYINGRRLGAPKKLLAHGDTVSLLGCKDMFNFKVTFEEPVCVATEPAAPSVPKTDLERGLECSICFELIAYAHSISSCECGQSYCFSCLVEGAQGRCPTCLRNFKTKDLVHTRCVDSLVRVVLKSVPEELNAWESRYGAQVVGRAQLIQPKQRGRAMKAAAEATVVRGAVVPESAPGTSAASTAAPASSPQSPSLPAPGQAAPVALNSGQRADSLVDKTMSDFGAETESDDDFDECVQEEEEEEEEEEEAKQAPISAEQIAVLKAEWAAELEATALHKAEIVRLQALYRRRYEQRRGAEIGASMRCHSAPASPLPKPAAAGPAFMGVVGIGSNNSDEVTAGVQLQLPCTSLDFSAATVEQGLRTVEVDRDVRFGAKRSRFSDV